MQAIELGAAAGTAPCPRCTSTMVLAVITPHPIAPQMQIEQPVVWKF